MSNKLPSISFRNSNEVVLDGNLHIPVPDGYRSAFGTSDGNENWFFIVPDNYPLSSNHINAAPYSFAVTTNPIGQVPFSVANKDFIIDYFMQQGWLDSSIEVQLVLLSMNCAFVYQSWMDFEDTSWNKLNGFLFSGDNARQFHVYSNHGKVKQSIDYIDSFISVGESWMKKVYLDDDNEVSFIYQ